MFHDADVHPSIPQTISVRLCLISAKESIEELEMGPVRHLSSWSQDNNLPLHFCGLHSPILPPLRARLCPQTPDSFDSPVYAWKNAVSTARSCHARFPSAKRVAVIAVVAVHASVAAHKDELQDEALERAAPSMAVNFKAPTLGALANARPRLPHEPEFRLNLNRPSTP
jgi:hypothetical protein